MTKSFSPKNMNLHPRNEIGAQGIFLEDIQNYQVGGNTSSRENILPFLCHYLKDNLSVGVLITKYFLTSGS